MAFACARPNLVTAAVNFSGFLAQSVEIPFSALSPDTPPIFWGHGSRDPNIPHAWAARGRERLNTAGILLQSKDYDIGHWIVPEEVRDAVAFVESI